ncbi:MAG: hypothetical protein K0R57_4612 [Paenibacillaceae bacterium]|jgi:DNA-binding transcriptional ArsR family regulator|nr:hypothetical protein [Paenibacillaceae bacterium]
MPSDKRYTPYPVTAEQAKLLESALRIKILHALSGEPRTSKQVADYLESTPGNIHYHIQKLYAGGLLELAHTQTAGGVVEKYYRSVSTVFQSTEFWEFDFLADGPRRRLGTRLSLSEQDFAEFSEQLDRLLEQWESRSTRGEEYGVSITVGRVGPGVAGDKNGKEGSSDAN